MAAVAEETIADRLSRLLADEGRGSLTRAAKAAGLTGGAVSKIANGETKAPEPETLRRLANHFRVRPDWLTHGLPPERDVAGEGDTPQARARVAAVALGFPPSAIALGTSEATRIEESDPWEILLLIRSVARAPAAPPPAAITKVKAIYPQAAEPRKRQDPKQPEPAEAPAVADEKEAT